MEFTSVSPVILGMLHLAPRSGYEIKQFVDRSTRFFWAASYGQIYPELRRLEGHGLVEGTPSPTGGRNRTVYRITPAGHEALLRWLRSSTLGHELRDEGLLKLFFAGALPEEEALGLLDAMRSRHESTAAELALLAPHVNERGGYPAVVLDAGIELHGATARWCARTEQSLLRAMNETREEV